MKNSIKHILLSTSQLRTPSMLLALAVVMFAYNNCGSPLASANNQSSKSSDSEARIYFTCDRRAATGVNGSSCVEYIGSTYANTSPSIAQSMCETEGGVIISSPCPRAETLGYCTTQTGSANSDVRDFFYADGGQPHTISSAQELCANLHGIYTSL